MEDSLKELDLSLLKEKGEQFEIDLEATDEEVDPLLATLREVGVRVRTGKTGIGRHGGYSHGDKTLAIYAELDTKTLEKVLQHDVLGERLVEISALKDQPSWLSPRRLRSAIFELYRRGGKLFYSVSKLEESDKSYRKAVKRSVEEERKHMEYRNLSWLLIPTRRHLSLLNY